MADFLVRFIGHIDETRRPDGFPKQIYSDMVCRVNGEAELKDMINGRCQQLIHDQFMIVPKDVTAESSIVKKAVRDDRMMVTMHLITHITTQTKQIVGEVPTVDENGNLSMSDGSKAVIQ